MSNFLSFISGTLVGAYIAQNYDIINIKNTSQLIIDYIKEKEKEKEKDNKNSKS